MRTKATGDKPSPTLKERWSRFSKSGPAPVQTKIHFCIALIFGTLFGWVEFLCKSTAWFRCPWTSASEVDDGLRFQDGAGVGEAKTEAKLTQDCLTVSYETQSLCNVRPLTNKTLLYFPFTIAWRSGSTIALKRLQAIAV